MSCCSSGGNRRICSRISAALMAAIYPGPWHRQAGFPAAAPSRGRARRPGRAGIPRLNRRLRPTFTDDFRVFRVFRGCLRGQHSAFRVPHSAFRVPCSAFRVPHSAFV
jgi:hypothetical protein